MTITTKARYWRDKAPVACELCHGPIGDEFIDGKLRTGPWALLCPDCSRKWGVGLGIGRGQRYTLQADGQWLNTTGRDARIPDAVTGI